MNKRKSEKKKWCSTATTAVVWKLNTERYYCVLKCKRSIKQNENLINGEGWVLLKRKIMAKVDWRRIFMCCSDCSNTCPGISQEYSKNAHFSSTLQLIVQINPNHPHTHLCVLCWIITIRPFAYTEKEFREKF